MENALNAARQVEGKTILRNHANLSAIAQNHACDMARMGQGTVAGSDGSNIVERARAVSYPTCGVVQLVTVGGTPTQVVNRWLASKPHREQVLGQLSTDIGAGVTIGPDGRQWWSVVMGHDCR
ncbi:MAG: CAP domain-containing protein [Paracoccus sp. (in: a-proteobacteria)]|nr:CAP domain-containing protein [Paracoccus sp. (in: a-proteobacteria)]